MSMHPSGRSEIVDIFLPRLPPAVLKWAGALALVEFAIFVCVTVYASFTREELDLWKAPDGVASHAPCYC